MEPVTDQHEQFARCWTTAQLWWPASSWRRCRSPEQESAPVYLEAGKRYYIEAMHKEAGGGDFLSVAWETPGSDIGVITGADLSPFQ